ncbi:MAG TPA: sigma-54 dependent transcriptional regulator [Verrucomicrobiota bacterium]|nr:DNA-binding response regulator [Verrucomicrobiales bacterium]HRI15169.1 sigma-54 dependent transcriptional regulator [Verrucomicrobiota bacterium]
MQAAILIVDDVPANRNLLADTLEPRGYEVLFAGDGAAALKTATTQRPDVILLDVLMPGLDGFETCRRLKADSATSAIPVIFITAQHDTASLVMGFHAGGVDYITKPFQSDEVLARVETHVSVSQLGRALAEKNAELMASNEQLRAEIARREQAEATLAETDTKLALISQQEAERWGLDGFVGRSPAFGHLVGDLRRLQEFPQTNVLIQGESGTGKELVARALHFGGPRGKGPFVPLNCASIPRELAESELFGHLRGSFTGAQADRKGCFERAHGGTLFLDELGTLPLEQQAKLLRVLEDKLVMPLGGTTARRVDVRVIAATNADLAGDVAAGRFRPDLYHRLATFTMVVPPLRERTEDIAEIARHLARRISSEMGRPAPTFSSEALASLAAHSFPGNVRELKNVVERALILSRSEEIRPEHIRIEEGVFSTLPATDSDRSAKATTQSDDLPLNLAAAELELIRRALRQTNQNVSQAAKLLGVDRGHIYRRLAVEHSGPS